MKLNPSKLCVGLMHSSTGIEIKRVILASLSHIHPFLPWPGAKKVLMASAKLDEIDLQRGGVEVQ